MTNRSDLDECSAQIKLLKQLLTQPETFDLDKVLIELETKKKLLMTFKPRDYTTILKGLESGLLIHPNIEESKRLLEAKKLKVIEDAEKVKVENLRLVAEKKAKKEAERVKKEAEKKALSEKELQDAKDKLAELEALKELEKEEVTTEEGE